MKIGMIGHKRIPGREGGIEIVVNELATRMAALGNEVDVYNRNCGEEKISQFNGVRIYEIPTSKKSSLNALIYSFFAALSAIPRHYDVIHFHAEGPCAMLPLAHLFNIRTVATIHGLDWDRAKWGGFAKRYLMFGEKMAVKYADEIIVLSKNVQEYFLKTYNRETVFIPNGINQTDRRMPRLIKEHYGLEKNSYILFLARITPEKGLDYLIEAYKNIETDKRLVIVGRTDPETEYVCSIKGKIADDDRIILTGFKQGEELEELFSNCLLYVLPSNIEGMPISLLEAVGFRARCLVSDIPENTEPTKGYAHTFKKGDSADLQNKLLYILDNEQYYDRNFIPDSTPEETDAKIDEIISRYSWDSITEETLELYKK